MRVMADTQQIAAAGQQQQAVHLAIIRRLQAENAAFKAAAIVSRRDQRRGSQKNPSLIRY